MRRAAPFLFILAILAFPALAASGVLAPLNDLLALGQAGGQEPAKVATARRAEPPLVATPRAQCGPGSKPEPGIQGRVPAGAATDGLRCNADLVSHQGTSGGFKVLRYVDPPGTSARTTTRRCCSRSTRSSSTPPRRAWPCST